MLSSKKIPTIIGIVVLVVGVAVGVFLTSQQQTFRLGASPTTEPQDVRVTNVTDASFTVSWTTQEPVVQFINWGETSALGSTASGTLTEPSTTHFVQVRSLRPNTQYFFTIATANEEFTDSGAPWAASTGTPLAAPASTSVLSGSVIAPDGAPARGALVYVSSGGVSPLSAITSASGQWLVPLSNARTTALNAAPTITDTTLFTLEVIDGAGLTSTAQVFPPSANPTPPITLGRSHDFRSAPSTSPEDLPRANLELPSGSTGRSSAFEAEELDTSSQVTTSAVTLESVNEGETVFTEKPEFFGEGPTGLVLTITVQSSHEQAGEVVIDNSGGWSWSPPEGLEEGEHTVTIEWADPVTGLLRSIERSFTVFAQEEEPAFESTPSAAIAPTPTPTATPSATPTPTELPDAGIGLPTIVGVAAGIFLLLGTLLLAI